MTKRKLKLDQQQKVYAGIAIAVILLVLAIFFSRPTGEAYYVSDRPNLGLLDLTSDPQAIIESLPDTSLSFDVRTATSPFLRSTRELTLTITKVNDQLYDLKIYTKVDPPATATLLAQDSLFVGGSDEVRVHLPDETNVFIDARPELKIESVNNQIIITNLHYLAAAGFNVDVFSNRSFMALGGRVNYGQLFRVNTSNRFEAVINVTGVEIGSPDTIMSLIPLIYNDSVSVQGWDILETSDRAQVHPWYPNSTVNISWTSPDGALAGLLNISLRVGNSQVNKFFRLAVDGLVYHSNESSYPFMNITFVNKNDWSQSNVAKLQVKFRPTTALQPFAAPCDLNQGSLNALFAGGNVDRVYTYDAEGQEAQVSVPGNLEFTEFESFKGYYIKLLSAVQTEFNFNCEMKTLQSAIRGLPSFLPPSFNSVTDVPGNEPVLKQGWNLFALPGVVPQLLSDFVPGEDFITFQCSQGETFCVELSMNDPLDPGKPYWVYIDNNFRGSSVYK